MNRWLISVPVWGERCVDVFCAAGLPALMRAVRILEAKHSVDARLVIHTDQADRIRGVAGRPIDARPVPAGAGTFESLSQAHREVLALGMLGDVVALMTADTVISEQGLRYCADTLANSQIMCVLVAVPRALQQGVIPDTGDAEKLMAWAWQNRHPMIQECLWPEGKSADLSRMFFERNGSVVTRQVLPAPLAVKIDGRVLRFTPTTDVNLVQCFNKSELHMTPDCKLLAWFEMSPADKDFQRADKTMQERLAAGMLRLPDEIQRWCFAHKVVLVGPAADCGDDAVVNKIMGG